MSTLSLLPASLFESLGLGILQQVADQVLGAGMLTLGDPGTGIDAGLRLPGGQVVHLDQLAAGPQGLSGRLYIEGLDSQPLAATLFDGFALALTAFDLTLANNSLAASHIAGRLSLPFFTDSAGQPKTVDVEIATRPDGSLAVTLAAVESAQPTTAEGLVQLVYDLPGGLGTVELDVASLEVDRTADGTWKLVISGKLILAAASLNWPSIDLRGLGIDSRGHIWLDGGWIDLPNQMALDFYGFHVGLQKLGFGNDAGGRWIGFNGDIHLVEGLSLGGSVRGLRIDLGTGAVSLDGIGIAFEIPGVLTIDGEIDHIHVAAHQPQDLAGAGLMPSIFDFIAPAGPAAPPAGKQVDVFAGQVKVVIEAAGGLEVDAGFIVGNFGGQSVFFLALDAELPVGIPIFADVSLYGLQGLVATGLQPHPEPDHTWWEWYKYPAGSAGPDLSRPPDYSASDVHKWLVPKQGAFALGAGATIGTSADDGFTVSAAITLVLMLPGPVISLIGKANILSKRLGGASEDASFEAMATYDGNSGTFDLTIDAKYEIPVVLDLEATAELYVGGGQWFFALGKPPHDKRVKARIFDLFEADAYFVVSDRGLVTGTWTGYRNSWDFGPLSASIDAYLATLAAIQWSPLQIGGGLELYGNIHLSAFGIGVGITADALLEGCAPNPFWVHGELSVELDLPWPLPDVGATISLTWGGDDGSVPPAPLALSHVDGTLVDHADAADHGSTDHYTLLAHRDGGYTPDLSIRYDPGKPGILDLTGAALAAWQARAASVPGLPDLDPAAPPAGQPVPVLAQDAHFTLNFAHPTLDATGAFDLALGWSDPAFPRDADIETPALPPAPPPPELMGADDMSNINPKPPPVQFNLRHTLTAVGLYQYDPGATPPWSLVCAAPPPASSAPPAGVTQLSGVWLRGDPAKSDPRQVMTQLKVFPWRLLPGQDWSAAWGSQSGAPAYGTSFTDQGLQFSLAPGLRPATIDTLGFSGCVAGMYLAIDGSRADPVLTLRFAQPSVVQSISAFIFVKDGEFSSFDPPKCLGDGLPLAPSGSSQDAGTHVWTLTFPATGPAIQTLAIPVSGVVLQLFALDWGSAPVPMAILPEAPALYALKTVTRIEAARVGAPDYQTVPNGSPIIEFVYFQTAAGPGCAQGDPAPAVLPRPVQPAPYLDLARNCNASQQPPAAFPLAGALTDLHTYTQWSWPPDGSAAAYYRYDVNAEFCESYVNALYTAFSQGSVADSLHFRCVSRNQAHTLLQPSAIHVPSIPQQSALVAGPITAPLPGPLQPARPRPAQAAGSLTPRQLAALEARATRQTDASVVPAAAPGFLLAAAPGLEAVAALNGRAGALNLRLIDPGLAGGLLHQLAEDDAARAAGALWFQPLLPGTRYTLDVVAGPWLRGSDRRPGAIGGGQPGSLQAIYAATDAIGVLAALKAYLAYEDALTPLQRVQFSTSRYATFSDHLANPAAQLAGAPGVAPVRSYGSATVAVTWLGGSGALLADWVAAGLKYLGDHNLLRTLAAGFDPLADDRQPGPGVAANGAGALVQARRQVTADWSAFDQGASALFDGLVTALDRPELASRAAPIPVPDTELSLLTDPGGTWVQALLLESPEPLPWRRLWRWIQLTSATGHAVPVLPLWSADGTRGLLVLLGRGTGAFHLGLAFQGNLGPEAPCITQGGRSLTEPVSVGPITLGRPGIRGPVNRLVPAAAPAPPARLAPILPWLGH